MVDLLLLRRPQTYLKNLGKRLIKSLKVCKRRTCSSRARFLPHIWRGEIDLVLERPLGFGAGNGLTRYSVGADVETISLRELADVLLALS